MLLYCCRSMLCRTLLLLWLPIVVVHVCTAELIPLRRSTLHCCHRLCCCTLSKHNTQHAIQGCHLSALPCPARVGKMLVYGAVLGCLDPVLSIAAALTCRSPFLSPRDPEGRAKSTAARRRMSLAAGGRRRVSLCIEYVYIYIYIYMCICICICIHISYIALIRTLNVQRVYHLCVQL
jgi:Helicase associated domain (HA2)